MAKAEGIKVTPEELNQEIDDLAAQYNIEADKIRSRFRSARSQLGFLEEGLLFDKVQDFLAENAVALTEEPAQEEEEQEEAKMRKKSTRKSYLGRTRNHQRE